MKRSIVILLIITALLVGGGLGWFLRGSQAGAPSTASTQSVATNQNSPASNGNQSTGMCTADELTAKLTVPSGSGAAGSRYYDLTLTNSSTTPCTLSGYPGVSLTDASATMVGNPAEKDVTAQPETFTLTQNQSANATIKISEAGNYPDGTCKDGVTTIKIYPPNDTGYLSVPSDPVTTWCPGFTTTALVKN